MRQDICKASLRFPLSLASRIQPQAQRSILDKFRIGELNLLIATAVAEEGLDICHCSLVVRFTLPPTARQHIQSRGRARAPNSQLVLMTERHNAVHTRLIADCKR